MAARIVAKPKAPCYPGPRRSTAYRRRLLGGGPPLRLAAQRRVLSSTSGSSGIDLEFNVTGMMCDGCTSRVEEELAKKPDVAAVQADLDSGLVTVTVAADDLSTAAGMMEDLVSEINGMGFEATPNL
jgi:copper chaperone CopZ